MHVSRIEHVHVSLRVSSIIKHEVWSELSVPMQQLSPYVALCFLQYESENLQSALNKSNSEHVGYKMLKRTSMVVIETGDRKSGFLLPKYIFDYLPLKIQLSDMSRGVLMSESYANCEKKKMYICSI